MLEIDALSRLMNDKFDSGDTGARKAMSVRLLTPSMSMTTPYWDHRQQGYSPSRRQTD
jgi:hypothetical protein